MQSVKEGSSMKIAKEIPYQRTSTIITEKPTIVLEMETAYHEWAKQLKDTPKEVKVRGTKRVLDGIVAGMVSNDSVQRPQPGFSYWSPEQPIYQETIGFSNDRMYPLYHETVGYYRFSDDNMYPLYGNEQFFVQQPPMNYFIQQEYCGCGNC